MASDLMDRVSSLEDGNAWPSTIELINDLADRITELEAEAARLRKALEKIEAAPAWGYPERWETTPSEVRRIARAALSGKEE